VSRIGSKFGVLLFVMSGLCIHCNLACELGTKHRACVTQIAFELECVLTVFDVYFYSPNMAH
jgi:hypothetical protein